MVLLQSTITSKISSLYPLPKKECKFLGNQGCLYIGLLLHVTYMAQISECSLLIDHLASDVTVVVTFQLTGLILQEMFPQSLVSAKEGGSYMALIIATNFH